jgi:hypothetical protein
MAFLFMVNLFSNETITKTQNNKMTTLPTQNNNMTKDNYTYNFNQIKCWFHSRVIYVQGIQGLGMWHYQEGQKTKNKTT